VSKLRRADYTQHLKGKTIERCHWNNEQEENYFCLSIVFTDQTFCSFRFHVALDEEVELSDFIDGKLSNDRKLTPLPIRMQVKPFGGRMKRRAFPYERVARLWNNGRSIREIGERIGYVDDREDGDRFHTLRNFLMRMHKGYRDRRGNVMKLPYRASRKLVRAAKARRSSDAKSAKTASKDGERRLTGFEVPWTHNPNTSSRRKRSPRFSPSPGAGCLNLRETRAASPAIR